MEQFHQQSPPPQTAQSQTERDMMYCHECHDEWYRDEHGLTCPECGSDFTEIIEAEHDPRADEDAMPDVGDDHEDLARPPLRLAQLLGGDPHQQLLQHHPWRDTPEPDDGNIRNFNLRQTGPGTFALTGTIYRSYSPARGGTRSPNPPDAMLGNFASMLNSIIGANRPGGAQGPTGGANQGANQGPNNDGGQARFDGQPQRGEGVTPGGHRFQYTHTARLFPREDGQSGPRVEPVDPLQNVLAGLFGAMAEPQGERQPGGEQQQHPAPPNPLAALFSLLMNPGNAVHGDAVYSQEALDRVISQLMEQNATGNAPGPASQDAINSLPKKQVTVDMLGPEGRAECSICMDEVNIGEEVSELPCHHWFHQPCIAAWLGEHDTCPHCRKGIMDPNKATGNNPSASSTAPGSGASSSGSSANPMGQMPGSFSVSGEGTPQHPYVVEDHTPERAQSERPSHERQPSHSGSAHSSGSGGIGDSIRRRLFGGGSGS